MSFLILGKAGTDLSILTRFALEIARWDFQPQKMVARNANLGQ